MPKLEILTVAENSYNSDEYAAKWVGGDSKWKGQTLCICIGKDRTLKLTPGNHGQPQIKIERFDTDSIDSLIEYLQDAKKFLREQDLVDMLTHGKRTRSW